MRNGYIPPKASLLDVLDRTLDKGVVTKGEVILSLADVDLIVLDLAAMLAGCAALDRAGTTARRRSEGAAPDPPPLRGACGSSAIAAPPTSPKAPVESKDAEKGLVKLVLVLVELLRKLMERQAVRRVAAGRLSAAACERVGRACLDLERQMAELRSHFGFAEKDLNLDLGPLGNLM